MTGLGLRMVTFAFGFRYPGWRYECAFGYAQIETSVQRCGGSVHWEPVFFCCNVLVGGVLVTTSIMMSLVHVVLTPVFGQRAQQQEMRVDDGTVTLVMRKPTVL